MISQTVLQATAALLSAAGLLISMLLHYRRKHGEIKESKGLVAGKHSSFLGVDIETYGILFYSLTAVFFTVQIFAKTTPSWLAFTTMFLTGAAVLFSIYLMYLEAFSGDERGIWSLVSGFLVLMIAAAGFSSLAEVSPVLTEYSTFLLWLSVIGSAVGLGTSIAFDSLYLTYLKDFTISEAQAESLNTLNHTTWASIGAVTLGTVGLFLSDTELIHEPAFAASAFVLGFIILNDSTYTLYLANKMADLTFADVDGEDFTTEKEASFMLASFSTVSWTALLTLQVLEPEMIVWNILAIYMSLLAVIGLGGLYFSSFMERKGSEKA